MEKRMFTVSLSVRTGWIFRRVEEVKRDGWIPKDQVVHSMTTTMVGVGKHIEACWGTRVWIYSILISRYQQGDLNTNDFGQSVFFENIDLRNVDQIQLVFK